MIDVKFNRKETVFHLTDWFWKKPQILFLMVDDATKTDYVITKVLAMKASGFWGRLGLKRLFVCELEELSKWQTYSAGENDDAK